MKHLVLLISILFCIGCDETQPQSASGVSKATVRVITDQNGQTIEQKNIIERLKRDNIIGSIKHLYIISAYSGQVLIYSTVKSKVTSSGKRLTPSTVNHCWNPSESEPNIGFPISIGNKRCTTGEVLGDDGSYGSSIEYLYWYDSRDVYHQHYVSSGQILHISDQPLSVPKVIINMESNTSSDLEKK